MSTEISWKARENILLAKKTIIALVETQGIVELRNMISMKRLFPLLAALLLLLSGCVEYDEELWLNSDGSGRAKVRLIHHSYYSNLEKITKQFEKTDVTLNNATSKQSGDNMIYELEFEFKSIDAFNSVNDRLAATDFWGLMTLGKNANGDIEYRRRISLGNKEEMEELPEFDPEQYNAPGSFEDGSYVDYEEYINNLPDDDDIVQGIYEQQQTEPQIWSYKLHVPWRIIHAGDAASIDRKHRVVTWEFDTQKLWSGSNEPAEMVVVMKKGISWIVWALIALAGALLVFFIVWMIRINRRSHLHEAIKHRRERESQNCK